MTLEGDDDLAEGVAVAEVAVRIDCVVEREFAVDDGAHPVRSDRSVHRLVVGAAADRDVPERDVVAEERVSDGRGGERADLGDAGVAVRGRDSLRECNAPLASAGYPAAFDESALDSP